MKTLSGDFVRANEVKVTILQTHHREARSEARRKDRTGQVTGDR